MLGDQGDHWCLDFFISDVISVESTWDFCCASQTASPLDSVLSSLLQCICIMCGLGNVLNPCSWSMQAGRWWSEVKHDCVRRVKGNTLLWGIWWCYLNVFVTNCFDHHFISGIVCGLIPVMPVTSWLGWEVAMQTWWYSDTHFHLRGCVSKLYARFGVWDKMYQLWGLIRWMWSCPDHN